MKKTLAVLLSASAVSAFAQIGDTPLTSKINDNVLTVFNNGLIQFNLLKDGTRSKNAIKYVGFSNHNNKYLNANLSNVDNIYFAFTMYYDDQDLDHGVRMFTHYDSTKNVFYSKTQLVDIRHSQLSADISADEIQQVNFKKSLERYKALYDTSKLVQIILEKDHSPGFPLAIGFITANNDSDLANNDCLIREFDVKTGKDLGGTTVYCRLF